MKYVAIIRPTGTAEIEAEGETLALARIELEAELPADIRPSPSGRVDRRDPPRPAPPASPAARGEREPCDWLLAVVRLQRPVQYAEVVEPKDDCLFERSFPPCGRGGLVRFEGVKFVGGDQELRCFAEHLEGSGRFTGNGRRLL